MPHTHEPYHTAEDTAIFKSTWIKVGHFVISVRSEKTSLYIKVVLHQL